MSAYDIAPAHRENLNRNGYTLLSAALPGELLQRWRNLAGDLESKALETHCRSENLHVTCVIEEPVGPRLMRYDDILGVDPDAVLDLLACPAIPALSEACISLPDLSRKAACFKPG